mmetsp:Transcript_6460/g.14031  ORF Transcript_6460/g.14031 Transcript_6460/m.14031 type:complete len:254 (-) Transcript_6460:2008-2769(-)
MNNFATGTDDHDTHLVPKNLRCHEPIRPRLPRHHKRLYLALLRIRSNLGQTEIRDFQSPGEIDQQIGRFQIPVYDGRSRLVQMIHSLGQLLRVNDLRALRYLRSAECIGLEYVQQGTSHEFRNHDFDVLRLGIGQHHDDVGMSQASHDGGFPPKIFQGQLFLLFRDGRLSYRFQSRGESIGALIHPGSIFQQPLLLNFGRLDALGRDQNPPPATFVNLPKGPGPDPLDHFQFVEIHLEILVFRLEERFLRGHG